MTERQALNQLMKVQGPHLAATAWEGFCAGGRGAVATDGHCNAAYFSSDLVHRIPGLVSQKLQRLVRRYDPTSELVAVLLVKLPSGGFMAAVGICRPALSPEACFLKLVGSPGMPPMQVVPVPVPEEAR